MSALDDVSLIILLLSISVLIGGNLSFLISRREKNDTFVFYSFSSFSIFVWMLSQYTAFRLIGSYGWRELFAGLIITAIIFFLTRVAMKK